VAADVEAVKELKCEVVAVRKGILVLARTTLGAGTNIPQITEDVQTVIRERVQDMLGVEEDIKVTVLVGKILPTRRSETKREDKEEDTSTYRGEIEY